MFTISNYNRKIIRYIYYVMSFNWVKADVWSKNIKNKKIEQKGWLEKVKFAYFFWLKNNISFLCDIKLTIRLWTCHGMNKTYPIFFLFRVVYGRRLIKFPPDRKSKVTNDIAKIYHRLRWQIYNNNTWLSIELETKCLWINFPRVLIYPILGIVLGYRRDLTLIR